MKRTRIYLLFKEYVDQSRPASHLYVKGESFPLDVTFLKSELNKIFSVLSYFNYEWADIYVDRRNMEGVLYQIRLLNQIFPSFETSVLSQMASLGVAIWKQDVNNNPCFFSQFDVTDDMLGDAARHHEYSVVLHNGAIDSIKGGLIFHSPGNIVSVHAVTDIPSLHTWLVERRMPVRRYDYNRKHGDASHPAQYITDRMGYCIKAAQLKTSRKVTEKLLALAVGEGKDSALWYYDQERESFIYFENQHESLQPAFHAYHLSEGDKNYENIDLEKLRIVQDVPGERKR